MDSYLLRAATLYALSATTKLQITTNPESDLFTYELVDLRVPLERLEQGTAVVVPRALEGPVLAIVRGCGDALARIDSAQTTQTAASGNTGVADGGQSVAREVGALRLCRRVLVLALEAVGL